MKPILISATLALLTTAAVQPALADKMRCAPVPASQWMPIEKVVTKAETLGYAIRETKQSKGCWKIKGFDRNGAKTSLYLDPTSGEIVR
ncbi:MAG: PepSY domain-containing protein [Afipia felis]|nr:PepSY domain-containing protein [Afipia felis]